MMYNAYQNLVFDELTLDQVVAYWAQKKPIETALMYNESKGLISWKTFNELINGCAHYLSPSIHEQDVIAVVGDNGLEFHVVINAIWRLGGTVVLIDRNWGESIVRDIIALTEAKHLFAAKQEKYAYLDSTVVHQFPSIYSAQTEAPDRRVGCDQIALYASTSGTTSNPKCIPISHREIRNAYRVGLSRHDLSKRTRAACLFDINSLGILGICFLLPREAGIGTITYQEFSLRNLGKYWEDILSGSADYVYLVPSVIRLLKALPYSLARDAKTLVFSAAAPISLEEIKDFEARFPVQVFNCYGLTELTCAVFWGSRLENGQPSDSIGAAIGIKAKILSEDGRTLEGPATGELYIQGSMLTKGYLKNASATEEMWIDGWLKTGDIARRDEEGRYYICGRSKDIVLRGGYTHYLHEIESYVQRAPFVVECLAFKGGDLPSGDELCLIIFPNMNLDIPTIKKWMVDHLGSSKVPNTIYLSKQALIRNSNGKLMRRTYHDLHIAGKL